LCKTKNIPEEIPVAKLKISGQHKTDATLELAQAQPASHLERRALISSTLIEFDVSRPSAVHFHHNSSDAEQQNDVTIW
jgi:hypothetical protein